MLVKFYFASLPLNSCSVLFQVLLLKRVGWLKVICRTAPKQQHHTSERDKMFLENSAHVFCTKTKLCHIYKTELGVVAAIQEETNKTKKTINKILVYNSSGRFNLSARRKQGLLVMRNSSVIPSYV